MDGKKKINLIKNFTIVLLFIIAPAMVLLQADQIFPPLKEKIIATDLHKFNLNVEQNKKKGLYGYYPRKYGSLFDVVGKRAAKNFSSSGILQDIESGFDVESIQIPYLDISLPSEFEDNQQDFTVSFWFVPKTLTRPSKHDLANVFWMGDINQADKTTQSLWINTQNKSFHFSSSVEAFNTEPGSVRENSLYHIVSVFSKEAQSFEFYINDKKIEGAQKRNHPLPKTNSLFFKKGFSPETSMSGTVGDISIWNRSLSKQQISSIFSANIVLKALKNLHILTNITEKNVDYLIDILILICLIIPLIAGMYLIFPLLGLGEFKTYVTKEVYVLLTMNFIMLIILTLI